VAEGQLDCAGPSVACSTAKAVEWDAEWKKAADAGSMLDQSGRAVDVHDDAAKVSSVRLFLLSIPVHNIIALVLTSEGVLQVF